MLTVESNTSLGFSAIHSAERNVVELMLALFSHLAICDPDDLHIHRQVDSLIVDFAHLRTVFDLLCPWLDSNEKRERLEQGLRQVGLSMEVRLKGKHIGTLGNGNAKMLTVMFSNVAPR